MKKKLIEYNIRLQKIRTEMSKLKAEREAIIEYYEKVLNSENKGVYKNLQLVKKTSHVKEYIVPAHDRFTYSLLSK